VVTGDGDDHIAFAPNFIDIKTRARRVLQVVTQVAMMNTHLAHHHTQRLAIKRPPPPP
jgi:hypothetical protein